MALLKIIELPCFDVNTEPHQGANLWLQTIEHEEYDYDPILLNGVYLNGNFYPVSINNKRSNTPIPIHRIKSWCYLPNTLIKH
jgi:hypothetical protein